MRSLFIKIFLWFWVAMALISFASFLSAVATESHPFFAVPWLARLIIHPPREGHLDMKPGPYGHRWSSVAGNSLRLAGESAVQIYEHEGKGPFLRYLRELEKAVGMEFFVFDEHNRRLTEAALPPAARRLCLHHGKEGLDFRRTGRAIFLAQRITGPSGKDYSLITRIPAHHFQPFDHGFWPLNLFIIFLTAGGVCYWLARYISMPISRLGAAARGLADGNLKARVGSVLGRRRDEIAELGRDFDVMAERLEALIGSKKRLLRDISHEFRSPLARLSVALEIARGGSGPQTANALDRIGLEAERLNALIGKLLMLARLESGMDEMDKEPFSLSELLEELVADADFEARGRNCRVRILSTRGGFVTGNRELLRSAVENVLRNAVRHTAEGSEVAVTLHCLPKSDGSSCLAIEVCDRGPGVPEGSLAQLFSPFYRVGDARDRRQGGTGLGLAITERAVTLYGGGVWAKNAPGGGLIVTIELPGSGATF